MEAVYAATVIKNMEEEPISLTMRRPSGSAAPPPAEPLTPWIPPVPAYEPAPTGLSPSVPMYSFLSGNLSSILFSLPTGIPSSLVPQLVQINPPSGIFFPQFGQNIFSPHILIIQVCSSKSGSVHCSSADKAVFAFLTYKNERLA